MEYRDISEKGFTIEMFGKWEGMQCCPRPTPGPLVVDEVYCPKFTARDAIDLRNMGPGSFRVN